MSKKFPVNEDTLKSMGLVETSPGIWEKPKETYKNLVFHKEPVQLLKRRQHEEKNCVFIPYQVPSKKNSQNIGRHKVTGKPTLYKSKQYIQYIRATQSYWQNLKPDFLRLLEGKEKPYQISFEFVRATRQAFDYVGPLETVQDLMQEFDWIGNDDARTMKPILEDFGVDKNNPGVYIRVL